LGQLGVRSLQGVAHEIERRQPFGAIAGCLGIQRGSRDERRSAIASLLTQPIRR
jgi:hypothetical protein